VATVREAPTLIVGSSVDRGGAMPGVLGDRFAELHRRGVEVVLASSLGEALDLLRARGVRSLFVEGGARLAGSLIGESLVDRLVIFRSSKMLGPGALRAFAFAPAGFEVSLERSRVVETRPFGDDRMTVYALREVPCSPD
jgi:diaminohydroxyphosphoribosylaminopyrimidine deaminase/5-amino-6-(5-phosphoribosylamino)uracil reductase